MIDGVGAARRLALNMARFSGVAPLAAPFLSGVGAILMLHRVNRERTPLGLNSHLTVTPEFLDDLLVDLKRSGHSFVSMDEAVENIVSGRGSRFIAITADDAYRDIATDALPVLRAHSAPITIYVAPGLTDGKITPWWDALEEIVTRADRIELESVSGLVKIETASPDQKRSANRRLELLLTSEIKEEDRQAALSRLARSAGVDLAAFSRQAFIDWQELAVLAGDPLVTIGAHTVNHYFLRRLAQEEALREIADASTLLRERLGAAPSHMAYPYGYERAVGPREVALAREAGFRSAVTTRHGVLQTGHGEHLHALPRISLNGRYQNVGYVRTMLSGVTTAMANKGRRLVTV